MNLKIIIYGSDEHRAMVSLRNRILREPWGLKFSEEDLAAEFDNYHIGCYVDSKLVGCCVLRALDEDRLQLRQMAVESDCQKSGLGAKILLFAEEVAKQNGYSTVYLHARKTATDFYGKYGYTIVGDEFVEVGMPHFEMKKSITKEIIMTKSWTTEEQIVLDTVSKYVDIKLVPFGKEPRTVFDIEKRNPMYDGDGVVYMLSVFEKGELVNNRIGVYMVLLNNGDQAGFHEHDSKNEQELYVLVHGEGCYTERLGQDSETRTMTLRKGNVTAIDGKDNYHSITNSGNEPLVIFVISTYLP